MTLILLQTLRLLRDALLVPAEAARVVLADINVVDAADKAAGPVALLLGRGEARERAFEANYHNGRLFYLGQRPLLVFFS
jgi:hypothetical protein